MTMTSRQRLTAALRGDPVDRVPIWLREGFAITEAAAAADDFRLGWQAESLYRELLEHVVPHCDDFVGWGISCINRQLMTAKSNFRRVVEEESPDRQRWRMEVETAEGTLTCRHEARRGTATTWHLEPLVKDPDDLVALAAVPWQVEPESIEQARGSYESARASAGDRYALRCFLSSPLVCVSGCMSFEDFLEYSIVDSTGLHALCEEMTRRQIAILEEVWAAGPIETTVTIGGCEQCTPPMMAPQSFDEFIVPYEGRVVKWLTERGVLVQCHCHGKVKHALKGMLAMGCAATDPVEPPPAGDCSLAEARAIVGDRLTLIGNLEWDELCFAETSHIAARVREILRDGGPQRLILSASAGPISAVDERLVANYRTLVDTALECS